MKNKIVLIISLLLLLQIIPLMKADGGYFPKPGYWVMPGQQKAIIFYENNVETLIVTSDFRGDAKDLVWVIPTPSKPEISKANEEIFSNIEQLTRPVYDNGIYTTRYALDEAMSGAKIDSRTVSVLSSQKVDYYDVVTLSASNSKDLVKWFNENGYQYPEEYSYVLDYYINKGWYFTVAKVSADSLGSKSVEQDMLEGHPTPIKLVFSSDKIVFPLKISSVDFKGGFKVSSNLVFDKKAIEHFKEIGYDDLAEEKSAKKIFNQIIADSLSDIKYEDSFAKNYSLIISSYEYYSLKNQYCNYDSCVRTNLENVFRNYLAESGVFDYYNYGYEYTPISIYIITDGKYETNNLYINYANWVKSKKIKELGEDENGSPLLETNSRKYFVTSLSGSLQKSQMDDDIYFKQSDNNSKVNAGPENWQIFLYSLLIIFILFTAWIFTPFGILFILGGLILFLSSNKTARVFGWIMETFSFVVSLVFVIIFLVIILLNNSWNYVTNSILAGGAILIILMGLFVILELKFRKKK
ncbi:MAG: DUF2330 domain-containing protein [Nanoarchaeota archaeon]